ncbi:DUF6264 family protein [Compostimonas suwonensis]|uniref:Uncharacterized protein n=1 Tax=Compostimonas suwonensis TaxID=1048394 RepID=A0A2M9BWC4_9MICO|nr:DUF6264 family protein [Compostimonas suwonensis]PJJ62225.1 hypothetical protein CLV54_2022 [Compostimonas suwonensis]
MTDTNDPDDSGQPGAEPPTQQPAEQPSDNRPRPRFGEYAPPGYVSPVTPPEPPPAPGPAVPPAPAAPSGQAPGPIAPGGNLPGYPPPGYSAGPPMGYPTQPPAAQKPRTWDLILTIILLVFGLFGAFFGSVSALSSPTTLAQFYSQEGLPDYVTPSNAGALITTIVVTHVVLYLIAVAGSILLLRRRRIAFWLPLVIGIVAAIIFWSVFATLVLADPAFADYVQQQSGI